MTDGARDKFFDRDLPKQIRVSLGSAMVLRLLRGKLDAKPTTAYLLTYRKGKCAANCGFCPQARESRGRADMLSRVSWPIFPTTPVLNGIKGAIERGQIRRVCLQALNYPEVHKHLVALVKAINSDNQIPISISCQPLNRENMEQLAEAKAERISIPLDAATEELFQKVKGQSIGGPYIWKEQFRLLSQAVEVFGRGKVSTHLIVGLGETEKEMVKTIQQCVDKGILPALFAFTPISGTALEDCAPPSLPKYRRVQIARHLILQGIIRYDHIQFDKNGKISGFGIDKEDLRIVETGEPFLTSGCPSCNRPYYNEKPSGPIYNYPKPLTAKEREEMHRLFKKC